jgi:type I restriction enzyme, S subunit
MTPLQLPDDWQWLSLKKVAVPRLGGNYRNRTTPSARPLIKMGNIARIRIDLSRLEYIPMNENVLPEHRLHFGDVLFNTRNTLELVGKVSIWRDELPCAYYNSNILRLELRDEYCASSVYFGYALNSKSSVDAIRSLATGTTSVAAVYTRDLLKLRVPVPPKREQSAIAAALVDIDDLITTLERLILKREAAKRGIMQQLLTGETRLPGFSGPWANTTAGAVGSFKGGSGFPLRHQGAKTGRYPFFKVSDMNNPGNDIFMKTANNYISEATRKTMGAVVMPEGAIVFAKVGGAVFLERKRILLKPSCIDNNMAAMVVDPARADVRFLHYSLTYFPMSSLVSTTALPSLNASQMRSIPMALPIDMAEQRAIAGVFGSADNEIGVLRSRLAKSKSVKQGMMQELLTGRTRLPVKEPAA